MAARGPADDVERLFRRLVANLAALDPARLHRPFPITEVTTSLVPYRTHRTILGFESSDDYDVAVLRFLAGEGGFAYVEPGEVAEALTQEALSVSPDVRIIKKFPAAQVRLDPVRVSDAMDMAAVVVEVETVPAPAPEPPAASAPEPAFADDTDDAASSLPFTMDEDEPLRPVAQPRAPMAGGGCPYCGGELPVGRAVLFCPHCGQNVGVVHCPTCDAELDVGWKFCITCGQQFTGGLG